MVRLVEISINNHSTITLATPECIYQQPWGIWIFQGTVVVNNIWLVLRKENGHAGCSFAKITIRTAQI